MVVVLYLPSLPICIHGAGGSSFDRGLLYVLIAAACLSYMPMYSTISQLQTATTKNQPQTTSTDHLHRLCICATS